jgi:hypothetical protein
MATQLSGIAPLFFKFLFISSLGLIFNCDYAVKKILTFCKLG